MTVVTVLLSASPEIIRMFQARKAAVAMAQSTGTVLIEIADMGCEACSALVGKALAKIPGAAGGLANFKAGTAELFLKDGAVIGREQVVGALKAIGYTVTAVRL
eukprot:SAG31_NODE_2611_length_5382_cov_3.775128_2_plen_104_part_00